jgi:hypothetical protein
MKKLFYFTMFFMAVIFTAKSQVTIGSSTAPDNNVLLDLKQDPTTNKGFLPPRVALDSLNLPNPLLANSGVLLEGTVVYNTATSTNQSSPNAVSPGLYYWHIDEASVGRWIKLQGENSSKTWFYMPSIVIDVTTSATGVLRDLYVEYRKQFEDGANGSTPAESLTPGNWLVKSDPNAPNPFTKIFADNELYYYVIGYDASVFSNIEVSSTGMLKYDINADNVTDATYMNIVFMVK